MLKKTRIILDVSGTDKVLNSFNHGGRSCKSLRSRESERNGY